MAVVRRMRTMAPSDRMTAISVGEAWPRQLENRQIIEEGAP